MPAKMVRTVQLTVEVEKDDDGLYPARCVELGTVSCGDTLVEAMYNIVDAVQVHLDALSNAGQLMEVFEEKGIAVIEQEEEIIEFRLALPPMDFPGQPEEWFAQGLHDAPVKLPVPALA